MADYFDKGFALVLADLLSLITISSCLFIKIPQIRTINQNKSAQGISVFGLCLELYSYSVMMAYNYTSGYEFLSYMEYPVLLIQEYVLVYCVFKYKDLLGRKTLAVTIMYLILAYIVFMKLMPIGVLVVLVPFCTPIGATSKVLQLVEILKSKDARSVSLTTWALSAFTNLTRVYTVYVQSADPMLLANFMISVVLSSSVFVTAYIYKKPKDV